MTTSQESASFKGKNEKQPLVDHVNAQEMPHLGCSGNGAGVGSAGPERLKSRPPKHFSVSATFSTRHRVWTAAAAAPVVALSRGAAGDGVGLRLLAGASAEGPERMAGNAGGHTAARMTGAFRAMPWVHRMWATVPNPTSNINTPPKHKTPLCTAAGCLVPFIPSSDMVLFFTSGPNISPPIGGL